MTKSCHMFVPLLSTEDLFTHFPGRSHNSLRRQPRTSFARAEGPKRRQRVSSALACTTVLRSQPPLAKRVREAGLSSEAEILACSDATENLYHTQILRGRAPRAWLQQLDLMCFMSPYHWTQPSRWLHTKFSVITHYCAAAHFHS